MKRIIDVAYIIITARFQVIIVDIPAKIITEFFIGAAFQAFATGHACPGHYLLYHQSG
jgi:hypothetical protein